MRAGSSSFGCVSNISGYVVLIIGVGLQGIGNSSAKLTAERGAAVLTARYWETYLPREKCLLSRIRLFQYDFPNRKLKRKQTNMGIIESLAERRSIYGINKQLPVNEEQVLDTIRKVTELVPDAFNMKSARVVVALGSKQDALWDAIYDAFGGKVAREKIDGFKAGAGTVLYFYDTDVVKGMQEQFPGYADNFPVWANQANGMLQISIWTALRELGVGANVQHYNPVIDDAVKKLFDVPESYKLLAQMPFGGIAAQPDAKPAEDIDARVKIAQ